MLFNWGVNDRAKRPTRGRDKARGTTLPRCNAYVIVRSNDVTPRHGHIGSGQTFKPCAGSRQPVQWIVWVNVASDSRAAKRGGKMIVAGESL